MIDAKRLLADLQRQVRMLEGDLRRRVDAEQELAGRLRKRYDAAHDGSRTGLPFATWLNQQLTQVAAGWVLGCVFTRFCEDNRLLDEAMLAGPGDRLAESRERQNLYFRERPHGSDLDYLRAAIARLERYDTTRALVDRHNPLHLVDPSPDAATEILNFWRRIDPETGAIVHDFTDPDDLSTRFLGDLYQDLSEQARKDYALLQTPEFVEEFILERTLDPAIDEYGLAEVRLIDPACGSGHFLLGAFARLLLRWREQEPGTDVNVHVERALGQVHGVDINPYAAAIARFRLVIAAVKECGITHLRDVKNWRVRVAIGDSLRFGVRHGQTVLTGVTEAALIDKPGEGEFVYEYEDAAELEEILGQRYHAVVGNPPYITVKDKVLNQVYRDLWDACHREYALSVPFAQRFFDLAVAGGFVGQITANSFMKREFGKKLVESFFPTVQLTNVIDTSGAYIPGHGTPTVILFGRNRRPLDSTLRAVLGVRGEPSAPAEPANGLVWTAIVENIDKPGAETEYVSVVEAARERLSSHPWSLSGGGAAEVVSLLGSSTPSRLADSCKLIGYTGQTNADEVFLAARSAFLRRGVEPSAHRQVVVGDVTRDWTIGESDHGLFLYDLEGLLPIEQFPGVQRWLWPCRTVTWARATFSKMTYREEGRSWWEWHQVALDRLRTPLSIAFAFVATHNHFVLDRGGKVFNRSAPVIKLPDGASEEEHLRLLGLLNSSTACFWLKQVCHDKGNRGGERSTARYEWEHFYEFTGTKLQEFPLPEGAPLGLATRLDELVRELQGVTPAAVAADLVPTREGFDKARNEWERIRAEMISAQEELDWEVYGLYGLLGDDADDLIGKDVTKPPLRLGERAFEIILARQVSAGEVETVWFARHGSTPITELPKHWPDDYRALVERRLRKIADDAYLHLIERPECKRRWSAKPWDDMEDEALRDWLLDRLEAHALWHRPAPTMRTVAQLADELRADRDFVSVAQIYARDADVADVVASLVKDQHVPYLAAWRYTDSGLRVRQEWERTWDLQRREDAGEKVGEIPVPPKYKQGDFRAGSYWRNRGKLDVPKERFVSYPDASRDGTLLLGWAGWDHLRQAQALATYVSERRELDAWGRDELTPLLAGLAELLPWVAQWHPDLDPEYGVRPADAYTAFLDEQLLQLGLTRGDLAAWRPPTATRGRRRGSSRGQ